MTKITDIYSFIFVDIPTAQSTVQIKVSRKINLLRKFNLKDILIM
jgi:hypothetical protein